MFVQDEAKLWNTSTLLKSIYVWKTKFYSRKSGHVCTCACTCMYRLV